jgi:hypothetical protein
MKKHLIYIILFFTLLSCNTFNNNTKDENEKKIINKPSEQTNQTQWTEADKQELFNELNPIISKYKKLGQEFANIYVKKITERLTPAQVQNANKAVINVIFNEALLATSPGWNNDSKNNFIKDCIKGAKTKGFRKNVDTYCECIFEKLSAQYPNPLIADIKSPEDTLVKYFSKKCIVEIMIKELKKLKI